MTFTAGRILGGGGMTATFTRQVDTATGRVDIAIVRPGDPTGVAGTGLLSAVLLDTVDGVPENIVVTGTAIDPREAPMQLQFGPALGMTVR